MAVMAAQARSLGFSLIFSAQDLPALEKRVKEEARSITANCNIKIFGKLEDPTSTREFFENTVGGATISKISSFEAGAGGGYSEQKGASISDVKKASYGELKNQKEGEAHIAFMADTVEARMFYANPKKVKAMRVGRYLRVNPQAVDAVLRDPAVDTIVKAFKTSDFSAAKAAPKPADVPEFETLRRGWMLEGEPKDWVRAGALAVSKLAYAQGLIKLSPAEKKAEVADDDDLAIDSLLAEFKASRNKPKAEPAARPVNLSSADDDDLDFSSLTGKSPAPESNAVQATDEDEDDLDFSKLFESDTSPAPPPSDFAQQATGETTLAAAPNLRSDIQVTAPMQTPTQPPVDLDEELLPPEQMMTSFIEDIMKRTGRALGNSLFGQADA
jgi:intracellular multiplication protein IcmO